jgi:MFS family permease
MQVRERERATMRKVSRRLIPYLFVLYVAAYLDRINVGFAQLQMKSALGFSDTVYGLGTGIFFLGYFLFEVPSNLILARTGARVWIARIMITWGLISSAMAMVRTPSEFYALRFLLGAAEAGFFPGVIYYLSQWFPAAERASAISRFMTATAIAGIVGGPLSAALFTLDGMSGLAGWQWIFVAEGIPSVLLGLTTLWFLTDRPAEAKWLSPADREYLDATMRAEAADIVRRGDVSLRHALFHPTVWWLSLLSFTLLVVCPRQRRSRAPFGDSLRRCGSGDGRGGNTLRPHAGAVSACRRCGARGGGRVCRDRRSSHSSTRLHCTVRRRDGRVQRDPRLLVAAHDVLERYGGGWSDRAHQFTG